MTERILKDRYRLLRRLGGGGQGEVHLAFDEKLNRQVAVKLMKASFDTSSSDADALRSFRREAKVTAMFSHPNVVKIYDYDVTDEGEPFLLMEYLQGETLQTVDPPLQPYEFALFVRQICSALQHAHDREMIHRDLKPANVMLVDRDRPEQRFILLDLGIAKLADVASKNSPTLGDMTFTGAGTPLYMSPEQITGSTVDHRTDIYALGGIMFLLLTGKAPFDGYRHMLHELLEAVAHKPAPLLSEAAPDNEFSAELEQLIADCLAKEPDERPQSMQEIAERFFAALDSAEALPAGGSTIWRTPGPESDSSPTGHSMQPAARSEQAEGRVLDNDEKGHSFNPEAPTMGAVPSRRQDQDLPANDSEQTDFETPLTSSSERMHAEHGATGVIGEPPHDQREDANPVASGNRESGDKTRGEPPAVDETPLPSRTDGASCPSNNEMRGEVEVSLSSDEEVAQEAISELGSEPPPTAMQQEAVRALEDLGAVLETNADGDVHCVDFTDTLSTDHELKHLKQLPTIETLVLSDTLITDLGLAHLRNLKSLRKLDLSRTEVTDAGLEHLKPLRSLQELDLEDTNVSYGGVEELRQALTQVDVRSNAEQTRQYALDVLKSAGAQIESASGETPLEGPTSADLSGTNIGDPELNCLRTLSGLQFLDLSGTQITDSGLEDLRSLLKLRELSLSGTRVGDRGMQHVAELANLEKLRLDESAVTDSGLEELKRLAQLEELDVRWTEVTQRGVEEFRRFMPKVRLFAEPPDEEIEEAAKLTPDREREQARQPQPVPEEDASDTAPEAQQEALAALEDLGARVDRADDGTCMAISLSRTHADDTDLEYIQAFPHLRKLSVRGSLVTNAGLRHIQNLTELEVLNLPQTGITDEGLKYLRKLTNIVSLNLAGTAITNAGLARLKPLTGLELLGLAYCSEITDAGLEHLRDLPYLTRLSISSSLVTELGVQHLKRLSGLQELEIFSTPDVDDEGLEELTQLVQTGAWGIKLSLRYREEITDSGLEHLKALKNLKELDLRNVDVSRASVRNLKRALPYCVMKR